MWGRCGKNSPGGDPASTTFSRATLEVRHAYGDIEAEEFVEGIGSTDEL